jgi:hypothetical protein
LFGSWFGLTSKGFRSSFVNATRVDSLGLIFKNYLNTCKA